MSQKQWAEVKADSLPSSFWDACCCADVMQSIRAFGMLEVCRWKIMISFIWYHFPVSVYVCFLSLDDKNTGASKIFGLLESPISWLFHLVWCSWSRSRLQCPRPWITSDNISRSSACPRTHMGRRGLHGPTVARPRVLRVRTWTQPGKMRKDKRHYSSKKSHLQSMIRSASKCQRRSSCVSAVTTVTT